MTFDDVTRDGVKFFAKSERVHWARQRDVRHAFFSRRVNSIGAKPSHRSMVDYHLQTRRFVPYLRSYMASSPLRCSLVLSLLVAACSSSGSGTTSSESDVVSIDDTAVKEQTIGNCWLYATAAWAEALHLNATHEGVDVSEGYWSFWYWFDEIVGGDLASSSLTLGEPILEGGWWGVAAEIAQRYGWMKETDFRSDATGTKADWHRQAVEEVNASLRSGLLSDARVRDDRVAVFRELVRIWKIAPDVAKELEETFEPGAVRNFERGAHIRGSRVQLASSLKARSADGTRTISLEDVFGTQERGSVVSEGRRLGPDAWSEVRYQYSDDDAGNAVRRALLANVQVALHNKTPVPIAWGVGDSTGGVYGGTQAYVSGLHESVIVDYAIDDVPGYGRFEIGQEITDPAALEASLDPSARVVAFRIKNSWGTDPFYSDEEWRQFGGYGSPPTEPKTSYLPARPGYNDIDIAYVDTRQPSLDDWYGANSHNLLAAALPNTLRFHVARPALKRSFVSFETYRANDLKAMGGADAVCSALAKAANLGSDYGAWLDQGTLSAASTFATEGNLYRAIRRIRATERAYPLAFGAYPGVTQNGVGTAASYWSAIDDGGGCAVDGTITDGVGTMSSAGCGTRHALFCIEL